MAKVKVTGKKAEYKDYEYRFNSNEDAQAFADCVESGGTVDACARQHRCIGRTYTRDQDLER